MTEKSPFISLAEASKLCSYSQEYLSLRARQRKLRAVKFGRNWMTTKEWLDDYIKATNGRKDSNRNGRDNKSKEVIKKSRLGFSKYHLRFKPLMVLILILIFMLSVFVLEDGLIFSARESLYGFSSRAQNYSKKSFSNLSFMSRDVISHKHLKWSALFPETASSINEISRLGSVGKYLDLASFHRRESIKNFVVNYLKVNNWLEKKFYALYSKARIVFSRFTKKKFVIKEEKPEGGISVPQTGESGMIVVPLGEDEIKKQKIKERIKKSFSDEVIVKPEGNGETGIIKPVFREGAGEDYLYILVPIKKGK